MCAPSDLVSPNAEQTYLWGDANHLSTAGQTIEADYIYNLLTAPSEISLLSESAVQVGRARVATIQRQIDLSGQHRGPNGVNAWVSAGADSLSFENLPHFPNASGTPFGGSMGADYQTPGGIILGMAATAGSQTQGFSTGGHFSQTGEALSLYAAYSTGPLWGDAIASYGLLQNHVARQVTLGVFTDQNNGEHRRTLAGTGTARWLRLPRGPGHHRSGAGCGAPAGAHRWLHGNRFNAASPLFRSADRPRVRPSANSAGAARWTWATGSRSRTWHGTMSGRTQTAR